VRRKPGLENLAEEVTENELLTVYPQLTVEYIRTPHRHSGAAKRHPESRNPPGKAAGRAPTSRPANIKRPRVQGGEHAKTKKHLPALPCRISLVAAVLAFWR